MPNQPIRNKVFRLDAARLSEDDSLVSVCIPYWFRRLLLDTTERYLWSKVWRDGDAEHILTEPEYEKIEYAIWRLTLECTPEEIVENMPITVTVNPVITVSGGGGGGDDDCGCNPVLIYTPPNSPSSSLPIPPVGDQPPPINTSTTPPPGWEMDAYQLARCAIANHGWTLIYQWLTILSGIREGAITIVAVLLFLSSSAPALILAIFGANFFLQLIGYLTQLAVIAEAFEDFFEDLKQYFVENRQELICRGYNAIDEIPLYEEFFTGIYDYMSNIWDVRGYTDELIALLTNILSLSLPSSMFGLFMYNEDPEFFGNYLPPIACDCGTGGGDPDDPWQVHYGIVGGHTESYITNTEEDHELNAYTAGAGAGGSYQQLQDVLEEYWQTTPGDLPFTAVTFTLTRLAMAAPGTGGGCTRTLRYGLNGYATTIMDPHVNAPETVVAYDEGGVTIGLRLSTHAVLDVDFEHVVASKEFLMPQFGLSCEGYNSASTTWILEISDFTLLA